MGAVPGVGTENVMKETINYLNGVYTGELKDGVPHGEGMIRYGDKGEFTGSWKNGKKHGEGYYDYYSTHEFDGLDTVTVRRIRGEWTDGVLLGAVWSYNHEEDIGERTTETFVLQDERGLRLLGIDRDGNIIGILADALTHPSPYFNKEILSRNGNIAWGMLVRDGITYVGQLGSDMESPYYAEDYVPHGFCVELEGERVVYCGYYDLGVRRGAGVTFDKDADSLYKMEYRVI